MTKTAICKNCGAEYERRVVRGIPVAVVNCPDCRAKRGGRKVEEAPKARAELRGPREGFVVVDAEGVVVARHPTKRAEAIAAAEAKGIEVE